MFNTFIVYILQFAAYWLQIDYWWLITDDWLLIIDSFAGVIVNAQIEIDLHLMRAGESNPSASSTCVERWSMHLHPLLRQTQYKLSAQEPGGLLAVTLRVRGVAAMILYFDVP